MIDAHHHFWRYNDEEFSWITPDMAVLRRNFGPVDLQREMAAAGVVGAISVQARTCLEETDYLLQAAAEHDFILGVVGWVDLKSPTVAADLDRYAAHSKFKGVREICQGAPDEQFFTNPSFNAGIRTLTEHGLPYDLLIFAHQLPAATTFVDQHPNQQFILDHCGKPEIRGSQPPDEWRRQLKELALRPNVACKLSGLVTELRAPAADWNLELLQPYLETTLDAFGPYRLMIGSDWPVLKLQSSYGDWLGMLNDWLTDHPPATRNAILSGTAARLYL